MLDLFGPLEQHLATLPWDQADLEADRYQRSSFLRSDLNVLEDDLAGDGSCPDAPAPTTLAAGFGCLYVLQGSALGGQIIARQVTDSLGLSLDATRFFRSDGRPVGKDWRAFRVALDAYISTPDRLDEATHAAAQTFLAFERCIALPAPGVDSLPSRR